MGRIYSYARNPILEINNQSRLSDKIKEMTWNELDLVTEPSPLLGKAAIRSMLFGQEPDLQILPVEEKNQSVTALAVGNKSLLLSQ